MWQSALTKVMGIEEGQLRSRGVKLGPMRSSWVKSGEVGSSGGKKGQEKSRPVTRVNLGSGGFRWS